MPLLGDHGGNPANRVIAEPNELRMLRAGLQNGQSIDPDIADEFGIPQDAINALPNVEMFLKKRGEWLLDMERLFIETFGLTVSDG